MPHPAAPQGQKLCIAKGGGFTLVEVALALGLIGFCLTALFGLLPIGLDSLRAANNEAAATNCLEQIVASIRSANLQSSSTTAYTAAGPYGAMSIWTFNGSPTKVPLTWGLGGNEVQATSQNLSTSGFPDLSPAGSQFTVFVDLLPPKGTTKTGTVLVSVAWPVQATWDKTSSNWKGAQGSVITQVVFLPNP